MCGTIMTPAKKLEPSIETVSHKYENLVLPKEFDARKKWDSCPTIGTILGWICGICSLRMLIVFNTRLMHLSIVQSLSCYVQYSLPGYVRYLSCVVGCACWQSWLILANLRSGTYMNSYYEFLRITIPSVYL